MSRRGMFVTLAVLATAVGVCHCRAPSCDDIDRMKTAIQNFVDGERSFIPTAVRFGQKTHFFPAGISANVPRILASFTTGTRNLCHPSSPKFDTYVKQSQSYRPSRATQENVLYVIHDFFSINYPLHPGRICKQISSYVHTHVHMYSSQAKMIPLHM
jgi:hypothetical protein